MKKILLLLLIPGFAFAQKKPKAKVPGKSTTVKTKIKEKVSAAPAVVDGYLITGQVQGFADGTPVGILNPQDGTAEAEAIIKQGKFELRGKMQVPDIRLLAFNRQPPFASIFLDNSIITVTGNNTAQDKLEVNGSPAHNDFAIFTKLMEPYNAAFVQNAKYDSALFRQAAATSYNYASTHTSSYITPFAIFRYYQSTEDIAKAEILLNQLSTEVKASPMSGALSGVLAQAKQAKIESSTSYILPDFTQNDTSGIPVKLSSFRGKYVLVDFWASWCGPCRDENPNVVAAFNKFKSKNFTILGVSLDKPGRKNDWIQAIHEDNLTWTHVSDLQHWDNAVAKQLQVRGIPQNYLLDPEGKVIGKNLRGAALERKLEEVLK